MSSVATNQINGNAFLALNKDYNSLKYTRSTISKRNAWPITLKESVDAWNFRCQVRKNMFFQNISCTNWYETLLSEPTFIVEVLKSNFSGTASTKICGGAKVICCLEAESKLFGEDVIDGLQDHYAKSFRKKCNCLPSCTSMQRLTELN